MNTAQIESTRAIKVSETQGELLGDLLGERVHLTKYSG